MIKEYCEYANKCVIRLGSYGSSFDRIESLVTEALRDFRLEKSDIDIVKYGGSYYAKTFGIEFTPTYGWTVPQSYTRIQQLEYTS